MEKKSLVLNILLAATLGAGFLVGIVWSAIQPNVVLADLDIPAMAALVLIACLLTLGIVAMVFVWLILLQGGL